VADAKVGVRPVDQLVVFERRQRSSRAAASKRNNCPLPAWTRRSQDSEEKVRIARLKNRSFFAFCRIWSKNEYEMLNGISRAPFDQK